MPPVLKAMPGRVILKFERPAEKVGAIYISEKSQRRPEIGTLVSLGEPLNADDALLHAQIEERSRLGHKWPISYGAGIGYWHKEVETIGDGLDMLRDLRVFRIDELASSIAEE